MKKASMIRKTMLSIVSLLMLSGATLNAQDAESSDVDVTVGADLVSSYVWRGGKAAGASVQPSLGVSYKGLGITAWGSTPLTDGTGKKEVDFTASYSVSGLGLALTDYWWDGDSTGKYFRSADGASGHMLEGSLSYSLPEAFPLSISWNTFFLGDGNKKGDGKNSYSTYVEFAYPFAIKDVDFSVSTGFTPWESVIYGTSGFQFISATVGASKELKITDSFSLPIFADVIFSPRYQDVNFVVGVSLAY